MKKLSVLYFKHSGWSRIASDSEMSVSMAAISSSEKDGLTLADNKAPDEVLFVTKKCTPLKRQSQQLSFALSSAGYFKSHCCKQCGPRSGCSQQSDQGPHCLPVCIKCLKSLQEYSAHDINRRHFQMQVFLVFEGFIFFLCLQGNVCCGIDI